MKTTVPISTQYGQRVELVLEAGEHYFRRGKRRHVVEGAVQIDISSFEKSGRDEQTRAELSQASQSGRCGRRCPVATQLLECRASAASQEPRA